VQEIVISDFPRKARAVSNLTPKGLRVISSLFGVESEILRQETGGRIVNDNAEGGQTSKTHSVILAHTSYTYLTMLATLSTFFWI